MSAGRRLRAPRRATVLVALGLTLGVAAAVVAALVGAGPASAHALLESSDPADGATLEAPPSEVTFTFSEGVRASVGGLRVVDAEGERVDTGAVSSDGSTASVGLQPDLPDGTYTAAFRVISADGHPVRGGIVFTVGEATQASSGPTVDDILGGSDRGYEVVAAVLRGLAYLGTFLAAGGGLFLLLVHDGGPGRGRLVRLVTVGAAVGAAAVLLEVPVQGALATGLGLTAITEDGVLADVLAEGAGLSTALVVLGLVATVVGVRWLRGAAARVVGLTGALVATAAFALSGHTRTTDPVALLTAIDAAHAVAGAAWFGGLVLLLLTLRRRLADEEAVAAAGVLSRFSIVATVAVVVSGIAGAVLAWAEVRELPALDSTYGLLLVAKLLVLGPVASLAAWNHWTLLPKVRQQDDDGERGKALRLVRKAVTVEAVGLVAVLAITGVLVNVTPARISAGVDVLYSETQPFGEGRELNLVVDPNRVGQNDIHLYIAEAGSGAPLDADPFESVLMRLTPPGEGLGAIEREPQFIVPGHYTLTGNELSIPGQWNIEVEAREGEFGQVAADFDVPVSP